MPHPFWPANPNLEVCEGNNPASLDPGRWRPITACFPHQQWWRHWRCRGFSAPEEKAILSAEGIRGRVTGRQQGCHGGGIQTLSLILWMPAPWILHSASLGLSSDPHPEDTVSQVVTLTTCLTQTSRDWAHCRSQEEDQLHSILGAPKAGQVLRLVPSTAEPKPQSLHATDLKVAPCPPRPPPSTSPHGGSVVPEEDFWQVATQILTAPRGSDHNKT